MAANEGLIISEKQMAQAPTHKLVDKISSNPGLTHENFCELTAGELDTVVGGVDAATPKLYQTACKGTHIPVVVIE